jgi:protein phosphatase
VTKCANCNIDVPDGKYCPECGVLCHSEESEQVGESAQGSKLGMLLAGKYRIDAVARTGTVNEYLGSAADQALAIREKVTSTEPKQMTNGSQDTAQSKVSQNDTEESLSLKAQFDLLRSLPSDAFPKAYDHFVENNREYLVLERLTGERLSDVVLSKSLDESTCADIAIQLCRAVGWLHQQNYAHMDVDPSNVFLQDAKIKLAVSDRARRLGSQCQDCLTTDGYSAPELYKTAAVKISPRLDVYSVGAILYTLLARRALQPGGSLTDLISVVPSTGLARILLSCLAVNAELRHKSMDDLEKELVAWKDRPKLNLRFDTAILSDVGMVRRNNEDCGLALDTVAWIESKPESFGLYVVADGMGGEQAGEVASSKAIGSIRQVVLESLNRAALADHDALIKSAIEKANQEIYLLAREHPALSSMGTTVTLGLRRGQDLYLGHVGDSRAYIARGGKIQQLTEDHSLVAGLVKAGLITPSEAKSHPDRGKIFRSLGNSPNVVIDAYKEGKLALQAGDILLFCTDGLVGNVSDDQILAEISRSATAHDACSRLIALANKSGGDDNVTVIVVKISLLT